LPKPGSQGLARLIKTGKKEFVHYEEGHRLGSMSFRCSFRSIPVSTAAISATAVSAAIPTATIPATAISAAIPTAAVSATAISIPATVLPRQSGIGS